LPGKHPVVVSSSDPVLHFEMRVTPLLGAVVATFGFAFGVNSFVAARKT
jgi:hypothetical protein